MLYNFVLVSAIQKGESVIIVCISLLSWASFLPQPHPSRWSQSARLGSLCYVATSHQLSILHMIVYICWCYFLYLSHYLLTPLCAQVYSLHLCFHSFLVNNFIGTIFLDSICVHLYTIFVFSFWLTSFSITDSRFIHLTRCKIFLSYKLLFFILIYIWYTVWTFSYIPEQLTGRWQGLSLPVAGCPFSWYAWSLSSQLRDF